MVTVDSHLEAPDVSDREELDPPGDEPAANGSLSGWVWFESCCAVAGS